MDMATAQTPASSSSYRINLGAAALAWETESMPYPRVMGDAVLLPDGTVFVANGGQIGDLHLLVCMQCSWHMITPLHDTAAHLMCKKLLGNVVAVSPCVTVFILLL